MKVILINGSPHETGTTFTALSQVANSLNKNGIETDKKELDIKAEAFALQKGSRSPRAAEQFINSLKTEG